MTIPHSKYWKKIILLNLLIGALPVILLGGYSYWRASSSAGMKVREANSTMLLLTQNNVEKELKIIDYSIIRVMDSPIIYSAMSRFMNSEEFQIINELSYALRGVRSFQIGPQTAFLADLEHNWIIDTEGVSQLSGSKHEETVYRYQEIPNSNFWVRMTTDDVSSGATSLMSIDLVKKVPLNSFHALGIVVIRMPLYQISRLVITDDYPGTVMILDEDLHVISHKDESFLGKDLSDENYIKTLSDSEVSVSEMEMVIDGSKHLVVFRKSEYNNWTYICMTPLSMILKESRSIRTLTIAICSSMFIILIFISFAGSTKIYHPVRVLYETIKNQSDDYIETEDEFGVISTRLSQLSKSYEQMLSTSVLQKEQLRELFVMKLLQGTLKNDPYDSFPSVIDHVRQWTKMNILLFRIATLVDSPFSKREFDMVLVALSSHVKEILAESSRLWPVIIEQYIVLVVGNDLEDEDKSDDWVTNLAQYLQKSISERYSVKSDIGISRAFTELKATVNIFRESVEVMKSRISQGQETIINIKKAYNHNSGIYVMPEQIRSDIIDAVTDVDRFKVGELIRELRELVKRDSIDIRDYKSIILKVIMDIVTVVNRKNGNLSLFNSEEDSILQQFICLVDYDSIDLFAMNKIIEPSMVLLEKKSREERYHLAEETIRIIERDYDTDITLESCASRLECSPDHLGRIFKRETGFNYIDYLIWYRVKVAKKLLTGTDMKILEISEKLRYSNPQNFIRTFRRIEGMTPGQYRVMFNRIRS